MKKFVLRTLLLIAIIIIIKLIIFIPVLFSLSDESKVYYGQSTNKSKIVLVGSSNIQHNYDYKLLNSEFYNYDVIGCNLNEPSGLYATINKLKMLNITSNDIIIFCLPHSFYEKDKFFPLRSYKKKGMSFQVLKDFINDFPLDFIEQVMVFKVKDSYLLLNKDRNFKETVDHISFLENPKIQSDKKYKSCWVNSDDSRFDIYSTSFEKDYINTVHDYIIESFDAKVLFRFPVIRQGKYRINAERINYLRNKYEFINDIYSSEYDEKYWFNQWYHLNMCGRDLCTSKLIDELETVLQDQTACCNNQLNK